MCSPAPSVGLITAHVVHTTWGYTQSMGSGWWAQFVSLVALGASGMKVFSELPEFSGYLLSGCRVQFT